MPTPTSSQRRAIQAPLGPTLVVAGPGAGKTFCLIHRAHHLIKKHRLDPTRILAVTFTNKAAEEVAHRLAELLGERGERIKGGTLHALCVEILKAHGEAVGVGRGFGIADEDYQLAALRRLGVWKEGRRRGLLTLFSRHRFQAYQLAEADGRLFQRYQGHLHERNVLDFDDLVVFTDELLRRFPATADAIAAQWDYVLVDEFQDLDHVQYGIVKALVGGHRNVFAVGDDEQSIFSWRGGDPALLRRFKDEFGVRQEIVLDRNRRCSRQIFQVARRLLAAQTSLFEKALEADRDSPFDVRAIGFPDEAEEAGWVVADLVADRAGAQLPWGEFAILHRYHDQGDVLETRLIEAGVPLRRTRRRALQDDAVIGSLAAALRLVSRPDDPVLAETFAARVLPEQVMNRVRAGREEKEEDFVVALRRFAESAQRGDPDARKVWRFIYHVGNLRATRLANTTLAGLIEDLLAQRVASWDNRLERQHERLLDPAEDPAAVALAARLCTVEAAEGTVILPPLGGVEIAVRGMLAKAGFARVRYATDDPRDAPGLADLVLEPESGGAEGVTVTVFRALQIHHVRALQAAFPNFVAFDLETTDKDAATCEIVEIGAVRVRDGHIVDRWQTLVKPERPIGHQATAVHGITDQEVAGAPPFAAIWEAFRSFVGDDVLVAHNGLEFDIPVLRRMAKGLPGADELTVFDSLPLARAVEPGSRKLEDLAARYGIDAGRAHRALDDALTLARVFPELERRKLIRARTAAGANWVDYTALGIVLEPDGAARSEWAGNLLDIGRTAALGRYSDCLEHYAADREQFAPGGAPPPEEVIERLGGRALMDRLRTERSVEERYPAAMDRLRGLLAGIHADTLDEAVEVFLERVALSTSAGADTDPHRVSLLTLHATKGLEFSRVYIVGVEDNVMPGWRTIRDGDENGVDEGRRLLYVGMTRAKDRLVLTRAAFRGGRDSGGSRYLTEAGLAVEGCEG